DGLCGTPSFVLHIAETLREAGVRPDALGLRYGLFGAEPWSEGIRAALERELGCPAYDIYGLSEIIVPGVAGEGEARDGPHLMRGRHARDQGRERLSVGGRSRTPRRSGDRAALPAGRRSPCHPRARGGARRARAGARRALRRDVRG